MNSPTLLYRLGPVILGASAFACADVLGKAALNDGTDLLTTITLRSYVGLIMLYPWLLLKPQPAMPDRSAKWILCGLGVLFTGNIFGLFTAFALVDVPIAVLTYFVYPLLTGLAAAATGVEKLSARGALAALAAFAGLALMIGAHPGGLAVLGIVAALGSALCRVAMLLIVRSRLAGTDARLITWYSLVVSTALFTLVWLGAWNWHMPASALGWVAVLALGPTTTIGILGVYVSTGRIGPFRTALFMNLEPLLATIGSAVFLGELLNGLQLLGGAIMLVALVSFQLRR
jgi:probable blue pigment (indigoidine) exporter